MVAMNESLSTHSYYRTVWGPWRVPVTIHLRPLTHRRSLSHTLALTLSRRATAAATAASHRRRHHMRTHLVLVEVVDPRRRRVRPAAAVSCCCARLRPLVDDGLDEPPRHANVGHACEPVPRHRLHRRHAVDEPELRASSLDKSRTNQLAAARSSVTDLCCLKHTADSERSRARGIRLGASRPMLHFGQTTPNFWEKRERGLCSLGP